MCGSRFFGLSLGLCLGLTISIPALAQCSDMDNDGFGRPGDTSCRNGGQSDCNDADPRINPAATEVCDGFDNDCDTLLDEGPDCDGVLAGVDKIGNDIQLTSNESSTGSPAIAWSGEHYAIVFNELPPTHDLFIIILDELGNIVVPQRPVFPAAVAVRPAFPDITFSGTEYGIVWEEYRDDVTDPEIYFARLTREGSLVGGALRLSHAPDESRTHP